MSEEKGIGIYPYIQIFWSWQAARDIIYFIDDRSSESPPEAIHRKHTIARSVNSAVDNGTTE